MINNLRMRSWIVLFLCVMTYSPFSNAWSLFGPKNFEDCVLNGMKGVTGDFAAKAVYKSCRDKFPNEKPVEAPKRSGTPRVDIWDAGIGNLLVSKVDLGAWKGRSLTVTNRNDFDLGGIFVGVPKVSGNYCYPNSDDYKEIYMCKGSVGANLTSSVDCSTLPVNTKICLTGLVGSAHVSDLDKWFKDVGYRK